jgi:N-acetylmuramoyl-L-alanine amidase
MKIVHKPSLNYDERRYRKIKYIIIHYTGMASSQASLRRLRDKKSKVSCHYFIDTNGLLSRLVDDKNIAWHAGISSWNNDKMLNKNSIGIEIQNKGEPTNYERFKSKQIKILIELILYLKSKYKVKDYNILGHSDISPDRKTDPGYLFPWILLKRKKIGLLPTKKISRKRNLKNSEISVVQKLLKEFGYQINISGNLDLQTILVLNVFQSHYVQEHTKYFLYDSSIILILKDLISQKNRCLTRKN